MLFLRSLIFYIVFYLNNTVQFLIFFIPFLFISQTTGFRIQKFWARSNIWLHEAVIGTRLEVRGREHIPEGGFVLASKHQSSHETWGRFPLSAGARVPRLHP
jgi:1-acyl-sn-glycerol-3-phosphate acyltransferase